MAVAKVAVTWELPTELGLNIVIPSAPSPAYAFLWLGVMCWNPGSDLLLMRAIMGRENIFQFLSGIL